jgi:hypothetical protein
MNYILSPGSTFKMLYGWKKNLRIGVTKESYVTSQQIFYWQCERKFSVSLKVTSKTNFGP